MKILCYCKKEARVLTVKKDNENKGRKFYTCATRSCKFFRWYDPVDVFEQISKPKNYVTLSWDQDRIVIQIPFDDQLNSLIKQHVKEIVWNAQLKQWECQKQSLPDIYELLKLLINNEKENKKENERLDTEEVSEIDPPESKSEQGIGVCNIIALFLIPIVVICLFAYVEITNKLLAL